ncbi:hypothetical protein HBI25_172200 [Parastagonospora nodorum]|nr:hypothetical protein HBI09_169430 [Parastagonospora nodorum]KAH4113577.1 hypothetical protein HBH47_207820 [Parastagonospora nodorum]KAH4206888.1 hypothetical protein HBI95_122040 [Parastagonospora nodorum]KAH4953571.1 hypothetical protein HBI78_232290 [Parastagonospora nodorum]KAH4998157.1 hypothetical protein HBI77_192040 [Parastagonospora nodorum]
MRRSRRHLLCISCIAFIKHFWASRDTAPTSGHLEFWKDYWAQCLDRHGFFGGLMHTHTVQHLFFSLLRSHDTLSSGRRPSEPARIAKEAVKSLLRCSRCL